MSEETYRHAMVAGASMAGLLAARVLSDHFDEVTLVDRDALSRQAEPRKGVPQGQHVHVLLARGHGIMERLFPGITDEFLGAGAFIINAGRQIAWHHCGGWRRRYASDLQLLALSRLLLESQVRERVRARPNVNIQDSVRVTGIKTENHRVTGVHGVMGRAKVTFDADLVVDATGRGSPVPRWLEELDCGSIETDTIPAPLTYSTCQFHRAKKNGPDWRALLVTGTDTRRAGFAWAIEGDRWLITLASLFEEPAPRDHEGFLSFAKSLTVPDLYDTIGNLEPLSNVIRYRFPGSQRRRYERAGDLPAGLIVVGDAVCSFNPVYGQGMTVAALEAEALGTALTEARRHGGLGAGFTRRWFKEIAKVIDVAWQGVSIEDFRLPELAHRRPASLRPLQWYMERVHRATHRSAKVTDQFYRVVGFLDPPATLFRPRVLANVLVPGRAR